MKNGTRIKKRVIDVDINVKVNVDADKAIEKLERIRDLYKEIDELKKEEVNVKQKILKGSKGNYTLHYSNEDTCSLLRERDGIYVFYPNGEKEKVSTFGKMNIKTNVD